MKKCIVIGGGFAGLSAAAFLSSSGYSVELIESSPKLGGRAYSFQDEETSCIIDNGQHILMGCYNDTLSFLKLIGAEKNFIIQEKLIVNFLQKDFKLIPLEAGNAIYPFNLLSALLKYPVLPVKERLILVGFFIKLPLISEKDLTRLTVTEWLIREGQTENIRRSFWDILAIGALNTDTGKASARIFLKILKEIFLQGSKSAVIILPGKGLTEAYCKDAAAYIENNNGKISSGETVTGAVVKNNRISGIVTSSRRIMEFDYIIPAVPYYAFKKIFPFIEMDMDYEYSSILSFHLWLKHNPFEKDFYGLIGSPVHWIFNHGTHITLVISNADEIISKSREELFELMIPELENYTPLKRDDIVKYRIVKEKRATFVPSNKIYDKRPGTETEFSNLFLAGDWVNTGLPSTIESAVKSGRISADAILNRN